MCRKAGKAARNGASAKRRNRIESERERLTKAGFSKTEISQILIAKETGAAQGMGGGGHGVLSGVLSNLAAVMTHARNFLPSLAVDLARMLSRRVPPLQRMEAAFTLVAKCAVIAVLAYVVQLEFVTLKANAQRAKADACEASMKALIDTMPANELMSGSTNDENRRALQMMRGTDALGLLLLAALAALALRRRRGAD